MRESREASWGDELKSFLSMKIFTSPEAVIDFISRHWKLSGRITKALANFRCFCGVEFQQRISFVDDLFEDT